jgi:AraC-like DNA-binding protein
MPGTAQAAIQRAGILCELPQLLRQHDLDPREIFAGSGVDPDILRADTFVRFESVLRLLQRSADATSCPHLGLMLGLRFKLPIHGILGRLMATSPTLRQCLVDFVSWQPGYSSGAIVYLIRINDAFAIGYGIHDHYPFGRRQLYDAVLGICLRMMQELTGGAVGPREVHVSYTEPANAALYRKLLKSPLLFGSEKTCMVLDPEAMDAPLPNADPDERKRILQQVRTAMREPVSRTSVRLRHVLRPLLYNGLPSMEAAALEMGLHVRTLRRRLAAEGATFENVRASVRFMMARELLEMTDLPVSQISAALAFASPGVFADAFRRWSGVSASQWRVGQRAIARA